MEEEHIEKALGQIKYKSDKMMDYFLISFFLIGLLLAFEYDTWGIAIGVGGLSLLAYYVTKKALPNDDLYQYVLSTVLGIFMAQFIYQMHGLFEMHFFAFVGSAILITYQNWKLQVPLAVVVVVHHAVFGYLQFIGFDEIYFTQLEYMSLQTFVIHGILATAIFVLCGLWAHNIRIFTDLQIRQGFKIGKLQEADTQKAAIIEERVKGEKKLACSYSLLEATLESTADGILVADSLGRITLFNKKFEKLWKLPRDKRAIRDKTKVFDFILQQLVDPDAFIANVQDVSLSKEAVSYDIIRFKDGRAFEGYSQPQLINGKSVGRVWSFHDITQRMQDEEDRDKMVADIMQRNKDLEQFTYIISHNLRAPVANILGCAEALKGDITEEIRTEFVNAISESTVKLDNIISDLNAILQVKQGTSELKEPVRFSDLVDDVRVSIRNLMEEQGVTIEADFSQINEFTTLKSYLYSVFYNLISNSIKYRQAGVSPHIRIHSRKHEQKVVLSFKDNGLGIDLAKRGPQVFGLYKRFHTDIAEGKGVGLYMTKTQVETLGGKINISSEVNKGTEFLIEFDN